MHSPRAMHPCFMTLAKVASFIAGTLLSLANRCEPSSHGSSSWITNITMLSFRTKAITDFDYVVYVKIIYSILSRLNSSETLSSSLSLSLLFWISIS